MARAFVMRPFNKKTDTKGTEFDFEKVHLELIQPALDATGYSGSTTGEIIDSGNIREDMFALILEADLVICDVSIHNANVFYELGIRHALRKKRTILIKGDLSTDNIPFDLLTDRYLAYSSENPAQTKEALIKMIKASLNSDRETDSPIFKMLPKLPDVDLKSVQILPTDFLEEVARAKAAKSKGWLRLLAEDVKGLRFQWLGMKHIAEAQWSQKDYIGAKGNLEEIHSGHEGIISINLTLANIYERLYRITNKPELLETSNQRIDSVLENTRATSAERIEGLTLKGRNLKTLWRQKFESLSLIEERRKRAANQKLKESYEAYKDAFDQFLNHFYSGLAALQMGTILLHLSEDDNTRWESIFDDDETANIFKKQLAEDIKIMQTVVSASLSASLSKMEKNDSNRVWAEISKADLKFLKDSNDERIVSAYLNAIPENDPFAWDATKGQLELFASLGVKGELATAIIDEVEKQQKKPDKKIDTHLILFVGHRIDTPDRSEPRFPADKADQAKELIRNELKKLDKTHQLIGLASASPGADILFHEVCLELNIPSKICLPMPSNIYAGLNFDNLESWQPRYFDLKEKLEVLELSDQEGLPRWLAEKPETDPWERGNRWVLQMGLTSDAAKVTLIALWDGKKTGVAPGGSAHMVQITQKSGEIRVISIDSKRLLS